MSTTPTTVARCRRGNLGDAFHRTALRHPGRTALIFNERSWSFGAFDTAVSRVARALLALGYGKGDRVAAYSRNSDAYVLLMLGCARAGIIHVPVNFGLSGDELVYVLAQAGAGALFHDSQGRANVAAVRARLDLRHVGTFDDGDAGGGDAPDVLSMASGAGDATPPEVDIDADDLAQIIYTSGTTSRPKGAMMSHGALLHNHRSAIHCFEFSEQTRAISAQPFYHAVLHVDCLPYLLAGATQFVLDRPEPRVMLELLQRERINTLFAPPTVIIKLLRDPGFDACDLSALTHILYGASIMPAATVAELKQRLPQAGLYNIYGQTEMGPIATVLYPHEHAQRPTSAGRPVFDTETRVVDTAMRDLPPGERGEIVHRAPSLLHGYWNKPEETAEAFQGGWFHSGDMGYRDAEGYLYVVDRIKDVINTGGVLVSSREVEECLFEHGAVAQAAVIGLTHPKWVEAIAAVVVLKEGAAAPEPALIAHARARLAHFKVPKRIVFTDSLPTNPSGKILKRELRETLRDLFAADLA
jgi:fatty-acyl-CoA synthase